MNLKKIVIPGLITLILIFPAVPVHAHPHIFIAQKLHIIFDEQGMAGIKVFWQFDDMFSNMIVMDHDINQNQKLEPNEVASIKENAFAYIANSDYFFFLKIDGKPFKVKYVKDFNARLIYGKLIYEFFIPCHVKANSNKKQIRIASYDPSYYSAVYYVKDRPFALKTDDSFETDAHIEKDPDTTIYYGMVNPWTLFLNFKLRQ